MSKKIENTQPKQYTAAQLAEHLVFPARLSKKQKKEADEVLLTALQKRRAAAHTQDKLKAVLLQLRFRMESYINEEQYDKSKTFGYFLKQYIHELNKRQTDFADEINITPAELSQYINNHRTPPENIIIRLELHSRNVIPATDWYRLVEKKNLHDLNANATLRKSQKPFVKKQAELV